MRKIFIVLNVVVCLCLVFSGEASGQYYVKSEISNEAPVLNEEIILTYSLMFKGNSISLSNPRFSFTAPSNLADNFEVAREGGNANMDMSFGQGIRIYSYTFVMKAKKKGPVTLEAASITMNEDTYTSAQVNFNISGASAPVVPTNAANFIQATVSRNNPYKGQEFYITYKLYSKGRVLNLGEIKPPQVEGFITSDLSPTERSLRVETINGEKLYVLDLYKARLYPTRAGDFTIKQLSAGVDIERLTGRYFRDFFGRRQAEVERVSLDLSSPELKVKVRPLPSPAPKSFAGAVGQYNAVAIVSSKETKTGEPITYRLRISGSGNLNYLSEPTLDLPKDIEVYEPKVKTVGNRKIYEFLLVPRREGNYKITPYTFAYFDPIKEAYQIVETETFDIAVGKGTQASGTNLANITKEEVALIDEDIRHIKGEAKLKKSEGWKIGDAPFFLRMGFPFLLLLPLYFLRIRNEKRMADGGLQRTMRAKSLAAKHLKEASLHLNKDSKVFYGALNSGLQGYVANRFGISFSELSSRRIEAEFQEVKLDEELTREFLSLMEVCQQRIYINGNDANTSKEDLQKAKTIIDKIESKLG